MTPEQEKAEESKTNKGPFGKAFPAEYDKADALDWAVFGCLTAGGVGIFKAFCMDNAIDVLLCLLGSLVAFGAVLFAHLRKD